MFIFIQKKASPEGEAGGRGGIRTHGTSLHKAFLVPHHRPLGHSSLERLLGIEPRSSGWKPEVMAIIR